MSHCLASRARIAVARIYINNLRPQALGLVKKNRFLQILQVKLFARIGHDHDWKLQAFTFVNGHNPYNIFLLPQNSSHRHISAAFAHILHKAQKAEKASVMGALKLPGPIIKSAQIGLPQRAARQAAYIFVIPRIAVYAQKQLRHAPPPRQTTPAF